MRRLLGPILVGVGAFLLVTGLLSRFYAYPALAMAPKDQNSVTKLAAKGATILDTSTLADVTTDLSVQDRTVGDVKGSDDAPDGDVVWVDTTSYRDSNQNVVSRSTERFAFDANSGEAVNCCGEFLEDTDGQRQPIKHVGLIDKWPFDTQKQTYKLWNATTGTAIDAKYVKSTSIDGMTVYQFEADVPETTVGALDVPPSILGQTGALPLTAQVRYSDDSTYWIEPTTGVIIDRSSVVKKSLAYQGEDKIITTAGTIAYTDAQVKANVDEYKGKASSLKLVHVWVPIFGILGGILLIIAGAVLAFQRRRTATVDSSSSSTDTAAAAS